MLEGDPEGGYLYERIWVNATRETLVTNIVFDDKQMRIEYVEHIDPYYDIQWQLFDALDEGDHMSECASHAEVEEANNDIALESVKEVDELYEQDISAI